MINEIEFHVLILYSVTLLKVFNSFRISMVTFLGALIHTNISSANVDI